MVTLWSASAMMQGMEHMGSLLSLTQFGLVARVFAAVQVK